MTHPNHLSFFRYIAAHQNRRFLIAGICSIVLQWVLFKLLYPFAEYSTDSYTYIYVAKTHTAVSFRPLGYSWFLQGLHYIAHSDLLVTTVQYVTLQLSVLLLFFTFRYLFNPGKRTTRIVYIALLFNPLTPFVSNFIMSDALFTTLSLLWIVQLCFIIKRPAWHQVITQSLLLLLAFEVRYSAMYYPIMTVIAFLLSRYKWAFSITGISLSILMLSGATWITRQMMLKHTGIQIFTGFSGWQIANNAIHIYPHVTVDEKAMPNKDFVDLHRMVRTYFDTTGLAIPSTGTATSDYMWIPPKINPLKAYMFRYMKEKKCNYFRAWVATGAIYNDYGKYLVKKHPVAFVRYYMLPNARQYFVSELDMFLSLNNAADPIAVKWFDYKSTKIYNHVPHKAQITFFNGFAWVLCLLNIVFLSTAAMVLFRWRKFGKVDIRRFVVLATAYWITNFVFSVGTSPLNLRYQLLTSILLSGFTLALLPQVWQILRTPKAIKTP